MRIAQSSLAVIGNVWKISAMRNEFTAITEKDGKWLVSYCPEVPGANGQGRTAEAAKKDLTVAIKMLSLPDPKR